MIRNAAIRKRMEDASPEVRVSRIIRDDAHPEWADKKCGSRRYGKCSALASWFIVRPRDEGRVAACNFCFASVLRLMVLAPIDEYLAEEAKQFERQRSNAREWAHDGCSGHSGLDPDGLCQRAVILKCEKCDEKLCAVHKTTHAHTRTRGRKRQRRQPKSPDLVKYEKAMKGE